jgi:LytS/YehU family sensor histidine kinase
MHISKFAKLLRSYLDSSRKRFIPLSEEITNIRNYIEIQQVRFGDLFSCEIEISDAIGNPNEVIIPSLLLQPIVENAITHGLLPKEEKGHLLIEIAPGQAPGEIICIVDDNGIGRKQSKLLNKDNAIKRESHGSNLVDELIAIINKFEKFRIEITYFDKEEPLTGTRVQLSIKRDQYGKV